MPQLDDGETVAVPSHDLTVRDGGQRLRLEWWHSSDVRARALFRVATDDDVVELVSLDCWPVSQRPVAVPSWCNSLDHIDDGLLLALRGAGYTPAEGV
jgi:hypothetical protein